MKKEELVRRVIQRVFDKLENLSPGVQAQKDRSRIVTGVSVRHIHLGHEDLEKLFGKGYELTPLKYLSQPGQYAAEETVTLVAKKLNAFENVRVLGPVRDKTQVELSKTDAIYLGVDAPTRISGDLKRSAQVVIIGPNGSVDLKEGAIRAERHIHMSKQSSEYFGLKDRDLVDVRVDGPRGLTFNNVVVRVSEDYKTEFHVDTDDANTCDLVNGSLVEIVDASCINTMSNRSNILTDEELIPPFIPDGSSSVHLERMPVKIPEVFEKDSPVPENNTTGEFLTLEEVKELLENGKKIDTKKYNLTPLALDFIDSRESE